MKRWILRMLALGLTLMLCTGAAAEGMDPLHYTMADKLKMQLDAGNGFVGTATLAATAADGRESEAFTTVKPITLDWTYLTVRADEETGKSGEGHFTLALNNNDYQQGNAEIIVKDGTVFLQSSLTGEDWYSLSNGSLPSALDTELTGVLPQSETIVQVQSLLPSSLTFFANMAGYSVGKSFVNLSASLEQYSTQVDFWLEGYRSSAQMDTRDDGTSIMMIEYRIPAKAVKEELKQLLIEMMNDGALLAELASLMPEEQAELYLNPSLQPYYFYTINELPLEGDLVINRAVSFLGDTVQLSVTMPLYDKANGNMTLQYTRKKNESDMPDENILRLTSEKGSTELTLHQEESNDTTTYQGTLRAENVQDGKTLWLAFDLSNNSVTTKDLNGYETLYERFKLSIEPGEIDEDADAKQYIAVPKLNAALDISFSSLSDFTDATDVNMTFTLSGEEMAQEISLDVSGSTTKYWIPKTPDLTQAVSLANMAESDRNALLTQAGIKAGLLFLPYIDLPQISVTPAATETIEPVSTATAEPTATIAPAATAETIPDETPASEPTESPEATITETPAIAED